MHQNKRIIMWLQHEYGEGNDNVKTVIEALEKQIPKKPINALDSDVKVHWYSCPICKQGIGWGRQRDVKYCWKCGQKLDWGE